MGQTAGPQNISRACDSFGERSPFTPVYCQVIIDISHANVDRLFTYRVPEELSVLPGHHVLVPFGSGNASKEGFVISLSETPPEHHPVKDVLRIIEPYTVLLPDQLELAEWIRKSYNCLLVDALRLMIPAQLRGGRVHEKVETTVLPAPDADIPVLMESLRDKSGKIRAQKQYEILQLFASGPMEFSKHDILSFVPKSQSALRALLDKGWLTESGHVTFRRPEIGAHMEAKPVLLNSAQQAAVQAVTDAMDAREGVLLLHGVTGSGKTEVYMHRSMQCI